MGLCPWTSLGEVTALPRPLAGRDWLIVPFPKNVTTPAVAFPALNFDPLGFTWTTACLPFWQCPRSTTADNSLVACA